MAVKATSGSGPAHPTTPREKAEAFRHRPEHRFPVLIAILVGLTTYALLPGFSPVLRYVVVALGLALLVPLVIANPKRLNAQYRWSRGTSILLCALLALANQIALVEVVVQLVRGDRSDGPMILLAAGQVWVTNIIVYALINWEMDRGGPIARRRDPRDRLPAADFLFPQDSLGGSVAEVARDSSQKADWMPGFIDYLYFSASTAMAYSPTDVMPLSHRAKISMLLEALSGFVILALVIARAVNLLHA